MTIRIGTAGWSIPRPHAAAFPVEGSHLVRYAQVFAAAEIDTSFYRPHRPATYARWAASVPDGFRFAVKLPREITHARRLVDVAAPLAGFLSACRALGDRLGPLLMQLPPSLAYDEALAGAAFRTVRAQTDGDVACEPRHASWFTDAAEAQMAAHLVARVAADPAVVPCAAQPGGWSGLRYHRLHGTPAIYRSAYAPETLAKTARALRAADVDSWCIYDNTASGAAAGDALATVRLLQMTV